MTIIQKRLVNAYTVLVMAKRMTLEEVPATPVKLEDDSDSTIRNEVEIEKAKREIEILTQ
ncbi:hypothetical protein SAMN02745784_03004 [Tissierella praeacuta DSM 18095]|uniref:Uncharacterized protein n=1 Tax=Tissierella praeacuta DSM 18095 TaxID=1123404 RepID=A0A1M4ZCI7_9FIRM|nr:CD1375 family protein [Tissierella praeacuta]TCU74220.1 hypothetical protein EV204_104258 [Tissierella praeacuta]SHF15731.1 hypothetical protein SAMN02745784_03004 [Tissierella praeacuta DSM 18095]SUO99585.1 Uncharacterised protein [Tissierella praeacuta]